MYNVVKETQFEGQTLTNQVVLAWLNKEERFEGEYNKCDPNGPHYQAVQAGLVVGWTEDEGYVLCRHETTKNELMEVSSFRDLVVKMGQNRAQFCCRVCGSSWLGGPETTEELVEALNECLGGTEEFPLPVDRCAAGCPGHLTEWDGVVLSHGLAAFSQESRDWRENLQGIIALPDGAEISCSGAYEPLGAVGVFLTGQITFAASADVFSDLTEDGSGRREIGEHKEGVTSLKRSNYDRCRGTTSGRYAEMFVRRPEILGLWVDSAEDPVTIVRVREAAAKLGLPYVRIGRGELDAAQAQLGECGLEEEVELDLDPRVRLDSRRAIAPWQHQGAVSTTIGDVTSITDLCEELGIDVPRPPFVEEEEYDPFWD